jgi:hypothetical protein
MNEESQKYLVSSIEKYWDIKTQNFIKYRCRWVLTNEKELADIVWNNVKDYEGAEYETR